MADGAGHLGPLPPWPTTFEAARELQLELSQRVDITSPLPPLTTVGGVDVSNSPGVSRIHAAAVRLDATTLSVCDEAGASAEAAFPYVPGFLSFREVPAVWLALDGLGSLPDLVMVDGHGYAHPRRFGIACHLGVLLDRPTLGCAKRILVGRHAPLADEPGAREPLIHRGELIGYALRTRRGVQPVYVSPGHRIRPDDAVEAVWRCVRRYRLPEPTRQAHLAANRFRRLAESS